MRVTVQLQLQGQTCKDVIAVQFSAETVKGHLEVFSVFVFMLLPAGVHLCLTLCKQQLPRMHCDSQALYMSEEFF